jgi:multiple sugar transport system permease protein
MTTPDLKGRTDAPPTPAATAAASRSLSARRRSDTIRGWMYMAPFAIAFVLFLVWPTISGFYMSFTARSLTGAGSELVGLANYSEAFGDSEMWKSLWNTVVFTVLSTIPLVVVALLLATLVNMNLKGQWVWRLSFFMPFLLASTVVSQFWLWMYNPQLGLVNEVLGWVGIEPKAWLQDPSTAMMSVVVTTVWWTVGFNFLLYLSALQNIPDHQYEAAALDGASTTRQFFSITLPQLGPTTVLVSILQLLASLKVFDQIYQMTGGGPGGATRPILQYVYEVGFTGYRLGYASAISYIFFFLIVVVSVVNIVVINRRGARS